MLGGGIWEDGKATVTIEDSGAVRVIGDKVIQGQQTALFLIIS